MVCGAQTRIGFVFKGVCQSAGDGTVCASGAGLPHDDASLTSVADATGGDIVIPWE